MKRINKNNPDKRNLFLISFLVIIAVFSFLNDVNAQGRHWNMGRGGRGSYMFSPRGYSHFAPRIGARIRVLPFGYTSFWIGEVPYYYYGGFYYQYIPDDETYVVVKKPDGADKVKDLKFDQVRMRDGSTLEGVFQSATSDAITLRIGDKNHDINITDIVAITFAPAIKDTTQQK